MGPATSGSDPGLRVGGPLTQREGEHRHQPGSRARAANFGDRVSSWEVGHGDGLILVVGLEARSLPESVWSLSNRSAV